ncbi:unnamed protein product [Rotaria sp. Silwood1]|nr:unnamed protein product [Rotaria sp. Silwood1]CAF4907725.1 unnamed protein product [Rotaria sp. Silwood1]
MCEILIIHIDPGLKHNETIRHRNAAIHRPFKSNTDSGTGTSSTSDIYYNYGGHVLTGATKVYILFYGGWTSAQINIIYTLISTIGSTAWFNIEKTYYYQATSTSSRIYTTGPLTLGGAWTLPYFYGTSLSGTNIPDALSYYITNGELPNDPNGIYLWLTSADVSESNSVVGGSFLSDYCGYHYTFLAGSTTYIYGFIGNPGRFIGHGCDPNNYNPTVSPNGDLGVDAMVSCIVHEIVEAMSDSWLDAWGDSSGYENADKW